MWRLLPLFVVGLATALGQSLSGLWDATVTVKDQTIPFRIELSGNQGWFFNGDEKVVSTAGRIDAGSVHLEFEYYAGTLDAVWKDGRLEGTYARPSGVYRFAARRFVPSTVPADAVPAIAGQWDLAVKSSKGEAAWRMIVRQAGPEVSAAILRVDGDTGVLTGAYRDGKFVLSHFSGARPSMFIVTPQKDGTLEVVQGGESMRAVRSAEARAQGLPEPTDPSRHTSVKDPTEPFHFSFPDLNGRLVSDSDERFRGKVVIVAIGGSWCPNCHDEAPFLMELYRKYHKLGLEIVGLSFEDGELLKNPTRLRAFVRKYGIEYPMLLAGETTELAAKVPQAVHLNAWPTTFYLGRDGRVRSVHAGFAGKASGEYHIELRAEVTRLVERLLAEPVNRGQATQSPFPR